MRTIVDRARRFAHVQHADQERKYTFEPYIIHPAAVARAIAADGFNEDVIAAAWLHDVVEDCGVTLDQIRHEFNYAIAELVREVAAISRKEQGSRAVRKEIDRKHYSHASAAGAAIKSADIIDNVRTIVAHDAGFARVYLPEKFELMKVLSEKHWPSCLVVEAHALVTREMFALIASSEAV